MSIEKISIRDSIEGLFIGNQLSFSDTILNLANKELSCMSFTRAASLNEVLFMSNDRAKTVRILIVDETMVSDLMGLMQALRSKFGHANIALAYRRPDNAKRLLEWGQATCLRGGIGFLPMNVEVDCWLSALRLLLSGECFVPSDLMKRDPSPLEPSELKPTDPMIEPSEPKKVPDPEIGHQAEGDVHLTERELQVLGRVAEGKQNKIIAEEMKLSQHTIKLHMHHVIAKLGVHNRTEAAIWYMRHLVHQ